MRTTIISTLALIGAAAAGASTCADGSRFGITLISPQTGTLLKSGDTLTVTTNYTCSNEYGIRPIATDYIIKNFYNNNGFEPDIYVTRRTNVSTIDTFTLNIPFYPSWFANASYVLYTQLLYPVKGTDGSSIYITGGTSNRLYIQPR